jgi:FixJ family two-component response regulator
MTFCHNCGLKLPTGNEKFCPNCGTDLQQKVQHTVNDVIGVAISGHGNIIVKDTKGNIFNFYIQNLSFEQLQNIMTSSTTLDVSQPYKTANDTTRELHNLTETKQQTAQVIEQINKIEKEKGREIQEIKVGEAKSQK